MEKDIVESIKNLLPEAIIRLDEPMSKHTTFRVGGCAEVFIQIQEEKQLATLLPFLEEMKEDYFILGNGSNLLVSDDGYHGVIIQVADSMNTILVEGTHITAKAGALLSKIAAVALENSLGGMEFASGIPGSIGGAVIMNAGAYDGEMKDIVRSVKMIDPKGNEVILSNEEMQFDYRFSALKNKNCVVTEVTLGLKIDEISKIKEKMQDFATRRKEKQPLNYPSAGSTFKRPEGHFAGKLIMDAGLKGYRVGGASVSSKHCGFIINENNATATDIWNLICTVQKVVNEKFDVQLETEVICLGKF